MRAPTCVHLVFCLLFRSEIATCMESAYKQLSLHDAQKLLFCRSVDEVREYALKRQWTVAGSGASQTLVFHSAPPAQASDIGFGSGSGSSAESTIADSLAYVRAFERIV